MEWKKLPEYIWAAPLTVTAHFYVLPLAILGWYKWIGVRDHALVWQFKHKRAPRFMDNLWRGWVTHTIGQVIVTRLHPDGAISGSTMRHAQAHVAQHMRLGILFPIIYALSSLGLWLTDGHAYYDNPFEISARRKACQYIDLVGLIDQVKKARRRGSR